MLSSYCDREITTRSYVVVIGDDESGKFYTFELKEHDISPNEVAPVTRIGKNEMPIFKKLVEAMSEARLIEKSAVTAELNATKSHLADMRSLVFEQIQPVEKI